MTSMTRLPTFCPVRPVSQPEITWDGLASMVKPNGSPFCQEAEKTLPVRQMTPEYCTTTLSPLVTVAPVPCRRTFVTRLVGAALPFGMVTVGGSSEVTVGRLPPPLQTVLPVA